MVLKKVHSKIVAEVQEALPRPGAFRGAVSGHQSSVVIIQVPADIAHST
jgi:hypothetical protein